MKRFLSLLMAAFVILLVPSQILAAEPGTAAAMRNEKVKIGGRNSSPKFEPGTPAPSELTADRESTSGAKRSPSPDSAADDERSVSSAVALPNTMDGLNDKRPLYIGDKLSFKVVEDEIAPRSLIVTDSLEIDVPYIGRVPVAHKTCKQFAYYVKQLLERDYYYQATVLVGLDSAGAGVRAPSRGKVYIMGLVRSPGAMEIPIDEALTVTKAIIRAGGFAPYANQKSVKLVRGGKGGAANKPIMINCAEILEKGLWDKDIGLNPEDIVTVSEKWINLF